MGRKNARFDVAIVGAGPAGASAARVLVSEGLDLVLFDLRRRPGHPVQCGEAVSATALRENGIEAGDWVVARVRGITVTAPGAPRGYLEAPGFCIDRARFDARLVEEAVARGSDLRAPCRVRAIHRENGRYRLETAGAPVQARWVVAADGPTSPTARSLGVVEEAVSHTGLQQKFPAHAVGVDPQWLHLYLAGRYDGGYAWIFPRSREVSVGVDVPRDPKGFLASFLWDLGLHDTPPRETNGGRIPARVRLRRLGVGNVLFVGDAAGATNPIFGGGIHGALSTGRMAAGAILDGLESGRLAGPLYHERVAQSPFFHSSLDAVANVFRTVDDEALRFAVRVYRNRGHPIRLLRLLPTLLRQPGLLRRVWELPRLRTALEITARYGW